MRYTVRDKEKDTRYIYIYIYKPAYYVTPEATNTPNNGRGFAIGRERRARGGVVSY